MGDEFPNGTELVVARKDHRLLATSAHTLVGLDLRFLHFQVHEALQDFEEAVSPKHLVPQIVGLPIPLNWRIARPGGCCPG